MPMLGDRYRPSTQVKNWLNPVLVGVGGFLNWPEQMSAPTASNTTLDTANEKLAIVFAAPKTGTIDRVVFYITTVTTAGTIDVRLETLDANGDPSGTLVATNANASVALSATGFNEVTLTAQAAVTAGDRIAIVLVNPAVSMANVAIAATFSTGALVPAASTYSDNFTGAWAKTRATIIGGVRYNDGSYPQIPQAILGKETSVSFSSSSSPDEVGSKFITPFACEVAGFWTHNFLDTDARTYRIYGADNSILASVAASGAFTNAAGVYQWLLPTRITLAAGNVVRLTMRPGAGAISRSILVAPSGMGAALFGGPNVAYTFRTDDGAWTDDGDTRSLMGLILSKVAAG